MKRIAVGMAVLALACLIAGLRYDVRQGSINGDAITLRVDRFTGRAEYLSRRDGWKSLDGVHASSVTPSVTRPSPGPEFCDSAKMTEDAKSNPYLETMCGRLSR